MRKSTSSCVLALICLLVTPSICEMSFLRHAELEDNEKSTHLQNILLDKKLFKAIRIEFQSHINPEREQTISVFLISRLFYLMFQKFIILRLEFEENQLMLWISEIITKSSDTFLQIAYSYNNTNQSQTMRILYHPVKKSDYRHR